MQGPGNTPPETYEEDVSRTGAQAVLVSRRIALKTLSLLALSACGGGGGGGSDGGGGNDGGTAPNPTPQPGPTPTPAPAPGGSVRQFRTWDAGSGPSRDFWSRHLQLRWRNPNTGDWLDASGQPQGGHPYASIPVERSAEWVTFDASTLVLKWRRSGLNRGFMLRIAGSSSPSISWSGRTSAFPPVLVAKRAGGAELSLLCEAFAGFSPSAARGLDTREQARTSSNQTNILQFDVAALPDDIVSASVRLYCTARSGTPTLMVFECDPPAFQLGSEGAAPRRGLAAEMSEAALRNHPDVIRAGDFSDLREGVLFDSLSLSENSPNRQLPDPDFPGSIMFRGAFTPAGRGAFSGKVETMRANPADPLRPPAVVENEMFCRLYFFLEDDWRSTRDANKMAIGWDLRMGWWNDAQGGYWQSTTGNGGARGTGLKIFAPARKNGGSQREDRWEYQGHSIRMEAGLGAGDGNPYDDMRPVESYVYNLDQPTGYGQVFRLGNAVIRRGRWHCIEQQIRMNSIVGPFDGLGNGEAVADGVLRTWLDGVLVSEVTDIRWRRHPEMGVQGPWINWYYGGKQASEIDMHFRMNHVVVARRYIGPRTT